MATTGQTMVNPNSGERCLWHTTAADTGGRLTRAEFWAPPGAGVATPHVHLHSDERIEVLEGRMCAQVGGRHRHLGPGDAMVLPRGVPHHWWNDGDEELRFMLEVEPAGGFERGIELLWRAAGAGHVDDRGRIRLLALAAIAPDLLRDGHAASPPRWVQRLVLGALGPLARRRVRLDR